MSMDFGREPWQAPQTGSDWLDDDLGDVLSLLNKDYSRPNAPVMTPEEEESQEERHFNSLMQDKDFSRPNGPVFSAPEEEHQEERHFNRLMQDRAFTNPTPPAFDVPNPAPHDEMDDIYALLERDYSKPQSARVPQYMTSPAEQFPAFQAAQPRQDRDFMPELATGHRPEAPHRSSAPAAPRKPEAPKARPSGGKDKWFGPLIGAAAGQAVAIALVWVLWALL